MRKSVRVYLIIIYCSPQRRSLFSQYWMYYSHINRIFQKRYFKIVFEFLFLFLNCFFFKYFRYNRSRRNGNQFIKYIVIVSCYFFFCWYFYKFAEDEKQFVGFLTSVIEEIKYSSERDGPNITFVGFLTSTMCFQTGF